VHFSDIEHYGLFSGLIKSSYIRLLIITMTERIMHSEKNMQNISNKQEKRTTDTRNECQYTCLYNIRTMKLLS